MNPRGHLTTELRNPRSTDLERMSSIELVRLINGEDAAVAPAVGLAGQAIADTIDLAVDSLKRGGRLIYVGAGTSGRLGILDASECPPTFQSRPDQVVGLIAGGSAALTHSVEGAEDDVGAGAKAVDGLGVGPSDTIVGISTGGTTPFVHGALDQARLRGAKTVFLACVTEGQVSITADVSIRILTGPEVLTGSTRMKGGTATKMVLNMISTATMVRLGKVYQNLMVDLNTCANAKLTDRARRIVETLTGLNRESAESLLQRAGGSVKTAVVMSSLHIDRSGAETRLKECGGLLAQVLDGGKAMNYS